MEFWISNFQANSSGLWLGYLLWNSLQMNVILMISQYWLMEWMSQCCPNIWGKVDPGLCHNMASQGHNKTSNHFDHVWLYTCCCLYTKMIRSKLIKNSLKLCTLITQYHRRCKHHESIKYFLACTILKSPNSFVIRPVDISLGTHNRRDWS